MTLSSEASTESVALTPQASVNADLDQASGFQSTGSLVNAAATLEKALATARATPYEIEFQTRIRLGMTLSDVYLALGKNQEARDMLAAEVQRRGGQNFGIGTNALSLYQQRDLPGAGSCRDTDFIPQDLIAADHQTDRCQGQDGGCNQAQHCA